MSDPADRPAEESRDPWARPAEDMRDPLARPAEHMRDPLAPIGPQPLHYPDPDAPPAFSPPEYRRPTYGQTQYDPPPASGTSSSPTVYPGVAPQTSGKATTVLVLGIIGLLLLVAAGVGVIPAAISLAMSGRAKREIDQSGGRLVGLGLITAARILSWLTVAVFVFFLVVVVIDTRGGRTGYSGV